MTKASVVVLAALALAVCAGAALAGDIVSMPSANQVGPGEVDLAQYYIHFNYPYAGLPSHAYFSTMYVGVTDRVELDVWYIDANRAPNETILNATGLVLSERKGDQLDLVVGVRDMGDNLNLVGRGAFVAAAKTLNPPAGPPTKSDTPIWRLHFGLGTNLGLATNLDRIAKDGAFGGIQALVTPAIGVIALWDGTDDIIGVTYTPDPKGPTFKGGVFGDHLWVGLNYTFKR